MKLNIRTNTEPFPLQYTSKFIIFDALLISKIKPGMNILVKKSVIVPLLLSDVPQYIRVAQRVYYR